MLWIDLIITLVTCILCLYMFFLIIPFRYKPVLSRTVCIVMQFVWAAAYIYLYKNYSGEQHHGMLLFVFFVPNACLSFFFSKYRDERAVLLYSFIGQLVLVSNVLPRIVLGVLGIDRVFEILFVFFFISLVTTFVRINGHTAAFELECLDSCRCQAATICTLMFAMMYVLVVYVESLGRSVKGMAVILFFCVGSVITMFTVLNGVGAQKKKFSEKTAQLTRQLEQADRLKNLKQSEIHAMKAVIHPHFIFNALNTIRFLIKTNADEAYALIYDFSKYLRFNFELLKTDEPIPFEEELEHIKSYLRIEQKRFSQRLNVEFEIEEKGFMIPPLCMQVLVEFAVKQNLLPKKTGGTLFINVTNKGSLMEIKLSDNGLGISIEDMRGEALAGIDYCRENILPLKGASLRVENEPGRGTVTTLIIPKVKVTKEDMF